jgi:hypothetical protein
MDKLPKLEDLLDTEGPEQLLPMEEGYQLLIGENDAGEKCYAVLDDEGTKVVEFAGDNLSPIIKLPTGQSITLNGVTIESI